MKKLALLSVFALTGGRLAADYTCPANYPIMAEDEYKVAVTGDCDQFGNRWIEMKGKGQKYMIEDSDDKGSFLYTCTGI